MPSHGIIPYRLGLREKGDRDNFYDLTDLYKADDSLPHDNIFDYFEKLLNKYKGQLDNNSQKQKTFVVDKYNINRVDNVVEGVVRTGDYGYTADLHDINTGKRTHQKGTDETELIPYYFLFHLPKTQAGKDHDGARKGVMAFQQFNGRSVKTAFTRRFYREFLKADDVAKDTMFECRPVMTQEVLNKIVDAERVLRAEFDVEKVPESNDAETQLIEGVSLAQTDRQSLVFKPKHGGSLSPLQERAKQLKKDNGSFAEIVQGPVEDLTITIEKENGRDETFSVMDEELRMKKELEPSSRQLSGGHPKTDYISKAAVNVINDVTPNRIVKRLRHSTAL
ncbi:hypothetical protein [Salarchaeum japonicum]|uniref:Uncharacterized protein n=1 Tax=Salarchaeum japonicum TaxID=555573 RepID=A0AAV3T026_9EURY|nr:hypothetical protein [Salarchaeum japonicum]